MKVYIIMRRPCDCEGRSCGFPEIYKIFINKEAAEKELNDKKRAWDYYYMVEKEVEAE